MISGFRIGFFGFGFIPLLSICLGERGISKMNPKAILICLVGGRGQALSTSMCWEVPDESKDWAAGRRFLEKKMNGS
jgi:hypothetical protein